MADTMYSLLEMSTPHADAYLENLRPAAVSEDSVVLLSSVRVLPELRRRDSALNDFLMTFSRSCRAIVRDRGGHPPHQTERNGVLDFVSCGWFEWRLCDRAAQAACATLVEFLRGEKPGGCALCITIGRHEYSAVRLLESMAANTISLDPKIWARLSATDQDYVRLCQGQPLFPSGDPMSAPREPSPEMAETGVS